MCRFAANWLEQITVRGSSFRNSAFAWSRSFPGRAATLQSAAIHAERWRPSWQWVNTRRPASCFWRIICHAAAMCSGFNGTRSSTASGVSRTRCAASFFATFRPNITPGGTSRHAGCRLSRLRYINFVPSSTGSRHHSAEGESLPFSLPKSRESPVA